MAGAVQALGQTFIRAGMSPAGAAGVIGNLVQESSLNPNAPGGGLAQWIGPRYTALQNFARSQGRAPNDPNVQAAFLVNEMRSQYPGLWNALRTTRDPQAAALAVSQQYERPGVPMNQNRVNYAASAYQQLVGGGGMSRMAGGQSSAPAAATNNSVTVSLPYQTQTFDQAGYNADKARYIAGQALSASQSTANPYNQAPGSSSGFAAALGKDEASLLAPGLLSTKAPNPQDYIQTRTATKNLTIATQQLQALSGRPLVNVHAGAGGDVNPIPGAVIGRTDMGVDANLKPGAPILAPNDARVVGSMPNWYKGQPYVAIQLLNGPNKGKVMYVAEQISGVPANGTVIRRGQPITRYAPNGTGIEIGWANPSNPTQTLAQATTGYSEGQQTRAGTNFRSYLGSF